MHHCHPCFGGHKPTGPICTTAPVIHPTKQCVTHSFQQRWCHTFSQHIQHMYIINKLKPKLLPTNKFKCKCCGPNRPRFGGGCGPCGHGHHGHHVSPFGPDQMYLRLDQTYHHSDRILDQTYHHSVQISDQTLVECLKVMIC